MGEYFADMTSFSFRRLQLLQTISCRYTLHIESMTIRLPATLPTVSPLEKPPGHSLIERRRRLRYQPILDTAGGEVGDRILSGAT